jgi:hypothetical protein
MIKLASFALSAAVGIAGVAQSLPAAACPAGVGYRAGVVVAPAGYFPVHYRPYYVHDRYWHHDDRYDRFHRGWEHGWDHGWDHR